MQKIRICQSFNAKKIQTDTIFCLKIIYNTLKNKDIQFLCIVQLKLQNIWVDEYDCVNKQRKHIADKK